MVLNITALAAGRDLCDGAPNFFFQHNLCVCSLYPNSFLITISDPEAARSGNSKITTTLGLVVHAAGNVGPIVST